MKLEKINCGIYSNFYLNLNVFGFKFVKHFHNFLNSDIFTDS